MTRPARLLIVLGIVAVICGGLIATMKLTEAGKHTARLESLAAQSDTVKTSLGDLNLEYRGFQKSVPTMPDSIRVGQSARIMHTFREYNKKISALELRQKTVKQEMKREESAKAEILADTRRVAGGLGGAGLLLLILGFILARRARRTGFGG